MLVDPELPRRLFGLGRRKLVLMDRWIDRPAVNGNGEPKRTIEAVAPGALNGHVQSSPEHYGLLMAKVYIGDVSLKV